MTPKTKLEILREAAIVLRNYALGEISDPVLGYRCHMAALELAAIRKEIEKETTR